MEPTLETLEPATSIIAAFGGRNQVCAITGRSRTRVYRWTQSKEKGGTGGLIPVEEAIKLLRHAKDHSLPISAEQFLPTDIPIEEMAEAAQ